MVKKQNKESGAILIFALVFALVMAIIVGSLVAYAGIQIRSHRQAISRVAGLNIAEAGVEMAIWKLNNVVTYTGEVGTPYGEGTYDISITDVSAGTKMITVDAYVPDAISPRAKRTIQVTTTTNTDNISFNYGAQVGEGGLQMDNNSEIIGNVYSDGNIDGGNNATITGTAIAANGAAITADQINDTPIPPAALINFRNATVADVAQSFTVSASGPVNSVDLYLRKVGNPSNFSAVRIVNDAAGNPGTTTIASGSLNASLVTNNYGWVSSTFSSNPVLTTGTTYWLVLDASGSHASHYYQWAANNNYVSGQAKTGTYSSGPWANAGFDGYFRLFMNGITHTIDRIDIGDDAWAHSVQHSHIDGTNFCQVGNGNNKACNTSKADPVPLALPISAGNILDWESDAEFGGTIGSQTINGTRSLGPVKINGDLVVTNGSTLTLTGTVWVTGDINIDTNATVKLAPGYGAGSGLLMAGTLGNATDGFIDLENGSSLLGSGVAGSYILFLSQKDNPTDVAINIANNSSTAIIYAGTGVLELANNAGAKEITGYKIHLKNDAVVTYESGLANAQFTSGPGASWGIIDQSWQLLQ